MHPYSYLFNHDVPIPARVLSPHSSPPSTVPTHSHTDLLTHCAIVKYHPDAQLTPIVSCLHHVHRVESYGDLVMRLLYETSMVLRDMG